MGKARAQALVLDAGALIAFERGNERVRALMRESLDGGRRLVFPAGVVAQVVRNPAEQVRLRGLMSGPTSSVPPLDHTLAEAAGTLCGRERALVVTSDVDDLRRLDPTLPLERV
jgi:hypothetical protein